MNQFGGTWTQARIEILVEYARAYLTIMKSREYFKLLYFDGFAGSGFIVKEKGIDVDVTVGAASRIIEINDPRSFDEYYSVEKDTKNVELLRRTPKRHFQIKKSTLHMVIAMRK